MQQLSVFSVLLAALVSPSVFAGGEADKIFYRLRRFFFVKAKLDVAHRGFQRGVEYRVAHVAPFVGARNARVQLSGSSQSQQEQCELTLFCELSVLCGWVEKD